MNTVDKKTAVIEINKWLDEIDFEDGRIDIDNEEDQTATESMLIKSVMDGRVTFNEKYELTCKLKNPVKSKENKIVLEELTFITSLPTFEYNKAMKGLKADDADGRMMATIGAFTNTATSRIDRLSTKEIRILQVIAGYLL